jgi:transposase-like protein
MENTNQFKRRKRQKGRGYKYDKAFKLKVAKLYFESNDTIQNIARTFNIPHQSISRWAREFSSELAEEIIIPPMTEQEQRDQEALQKQIEALKKKLEYEEMKIFALETMIDLAKTELGIDIRKNFGAKQPKE